MAAAGPCRSGCGAGQRGGAGAVERDVFPPHYRANTPASLEAATRDAGFTASSVVYVATLHRYGARVPGAAHVLRSPSARSPSGAGPLIVAAYRATRLPVPECGRRREPALVAVAGVRCPGRYISAEPLLSKPIACWAPTAAARAKLSIVRPDPPRAPIRISDPLPELVRIRAGRQQPPPHVHCHESTIVGRDEIATPLDTSSGLPSHHVRHRAPALGVAVDVDHRLRRRCQRRQSHLRDAADLRKQHRAGRGHGHLRPGRLAADDRERRGGGGGGRAQRRRTRPPARICRARSGCARCGCR